MQDDRLTSRAVVPDIDEGHTVRVLHLISDAKGFSQWVTRAEEQIEACYFLPFFVKDIPDTNSFTSDAYSA